MCCFRLTINKILWRYLKIEKKNGLIYQLNWFSLGGKLAGIMGCKLPAWTRLFNWKCVIFLMRYWIYENVGKLRKMLQKIYRYKSVTQTWRRAQQRDRSPKTCIAGIENFGKRQLCWTHFWLYWWELDFPSTISSSMIIQFFLSHPSKDNEVSLNAYVMFQPVR